MDERQEPTSDGTMADGTTFFRNVSCAYFPCHEGVDPARFNCLFCYCPLYALGPRCGGSFSYTATGVKDCSTCTVLHDGAGGAAVVRKRFALLAELARQTTDAETLRPAGTEREERRVADTASEVPRHPNGAGDRRPLWPAGAEAKESQP